jgi:dTMP kinase
VSGAVFVVLEGPDGVGKSTHARMLARHLDAVLTREPGGTAIGLHIRRLLLDHGTTDLDHRAEALLMAADRAQHIAEVVRPALASGRHVVSDRFLYSSVAYQGAGRGLPAEEIRGLSLWASGGLEPDVVVLLDAPDEVLRARRPGRGAGPADRLEVEADDFHDRVLASYRHQAASDPTRWVVVDAGGTLPATQEAVLAAIRPRLGGR